MLLKQEENKNSNTRLLWAFFFLVLFLSRVSVLPLDSSNGMVHDQLYQERGISDRNLWSVDQSIQFELKKLLIDP